MITSAFLVDPSGMAKVFTALAAQSLLGQTFYLFCIVLGAKCATLKAHQWTDLDLERAGSG